MDLEYSEDQRALATALRADLVGSATAQLVPHGLHGLEVRAADGGLDLGIAMSAIVCEELGRAAASDRYRATALLADLLAHADRRDLLPGLVKGEVAAQLVRADPPLRSSHDRGRILLRGRCDLSGETTDGLSMLIAPAAYVGNDCADDESIGLAAFSVHDLPNGGRSSPAGLEVESAVSVVTVPLAEAGRPSGVAVRARIRQAAYLLGLAEGAHELARGWAVRRAQFGAAIGENQAVAFPLARQQADIEAVRMLLHLACWRSDRDEDAALAATQSLAYAADLALDTTASSVHVHGAFGLTRRSVVHRHYEAAAVEAVRWGSPDLLWAQAGELGSSA